MKKYYYADKDNKPQGPCTFAELKQLANIGVITIGTNIIVEGASTWSRWEEIQAAESSAEIAHAVVAKASQMGEAFKAYDWGGFFFGLFLVLIECLLLPYSLLRKSAFDLSTWGRNKLLPTAKSDLPVLTFLTVVTRPAVHILWTGYYSFKALNFLFTGKLKLSLFGLFNSYQQVEFPDRFYYFLGMAVLIYFTNFLIGLCFDGLSLLVSMANSLKKIEPK